MAVEGNVDEALLEQCLRALYHAPPAKPSLALLLDLHGDPEGFRNALVVAFTAGQAATPAAAATSVVLYRSYGMYSSIELKTAAGTVLYTINKSTTRGSVDQWICAELPGSHTVREVKVQTDDRESAAEQAVLHCAEDYRRWLSENLGIAVTVDVVHALDSET